MNITYAALSRYPLNQREAVFQTWLAELRVQIAWDLLGSEVNDER